MYKIIALMGKAGCGKDTIVKSILSQSDNFHRIVSHTTRPIRDNEIEGIHYHFISSEEFFYKQSQNDFLETAHFNNWFYGTSYNSLREDKINIGAFNIQGIKSLSKIPNIQLYTYYIHTSDKQRMLRQLNREDNPNIKEIIRRFQTDESDFQDIPFSDYVTLTNEQDTDLQLNCNIILSNLD